MSALQATLALPTGETIEGIDLPLVVIDEDFFEYLEEESANESLDVVELLEYWTEWEKENCE